MKNEFKSFNPFESFVDKFGTKQKKEDSPWMFALAMFLFVACVILAHFI